MYRWWTCVCTHACVVTRVYAYYNGGQARRFPSPSGTLEAYNRSDWRLQQMFAVDHPDVLHTHTRKRTGLTSCVAVANCSSRVDTLSRATRSLSRTCKTHQEHRYALFQNYTIIKIEHSALLTCFCFILSFT